MMHKLIQRAMAVVATVALAAGALLTATPAYAAGNGVLTVTSTNATSVGKDVDIYRMFMADKVDGGASYSLVAPWDDFFNEKVAAANTDGTPGVSSDEAVTYVRGLTNEKNLIDFAKLAGEWLGVQDPAVSATATKQFEGSEAPYAASFTNLDLGYYLVLPMDGSTSTTRGTSAMLVNVLDDTAKIEIKSQYPTVDKTAEEGDLDSVKPGDNHASVNVGDTITFSLKSTVPDMSDFEDYFFYFTDTLSDGLTFGEIKSVKIGDAVVLVDETAADAGSADGTYRFTHPGNNLQKIRIDINNAYNLFKAHSGDTIEVIYTAVVNQNAVTGEEDGPVYGEDNTNSADVNFSTNPDGTGEGSSTPDKVHTYTFGFDVTKVDAADNDKPLEGAIFELQDADGNAIEFSAQVIGGVTYYRPAKDNAFDDVDAQVVTQLKSAADGKIHFIGLAEGEYSLVEIQAPAGYNKLEQPIRVDIAAAYRENGELESWSVQFNGDPENEWQYGTTVEVPANLIVENHTGTLLPGTGGMGTVIFTVVGVAAIAGGAIWYVSRRRATSNGAHAA